MSPLSAKSLISKMNKKQKLPKKSKFNRKRCSAENSSSIPSDRNMGYRPAININQLDISKRKYSEYNSEESDEEQPENVKSKITLLNRSVPRPAYRPMSPSKRLQLAMADHKKKLEDLQLKYDKLAEQKVSYSKGSKGYLVYLQSIYFSHLKSTYPWKGRQLLNIKFHNAWFFRILHYC